MKKLLLLIGCLWMAASVAAHEIDSLYNAFLTSRGENAVRLANEIVTMAGDSAGFTNDTPSDAMNDKLLKTLIFWHFDRTEMVEVISYANKAIEQYSQKYGGLLQHSRSGLPTHGST